TSTQGFRAMTRNLLLFAAIVGMSSALATNVQAGWPVSYNNASVIAAEQAATYPWHGGYYYQNWHTPMALVVPPTASMQTNYSWGVPSTRMTPINHQFTPVNPGPAGDLSHLQPTPYWPNNTYQFGVYYVRGPWKHREPNYNGCHYRGCGLFNRCGSGCSDGSCQTCR
ncbi:MAG: hypothetical protein ACIALR_04605, partial [Blastopirellula sp. JB062]